MNHINCSERGERYLPCSQIGMSYFQEPQEEGKTPEHILLWSNDNCNEQLKHGHISIYIYMEDISSTSFSTPDI